MTDSPAPESDRGLYRALFNVNTAIKLLIDPKSGLIVDANHAAQEFYGWTVDELRRMEITEINTLSEEEVHAEMRAAQTARRTYFRFRHRIKSGEIRHVDVHSGPILLGDRELLFSIIHDMTERDALEAELRETQRLDAVGKLAGSLAHEFNNLLTVMLTTTGLLDRKLGDAAARPHLRDLEFAIDRAAQLTRGLLAFSRRQVMEPQRLHLNRVVRDLVGLLQRSLGDMVVIQLDLDPNLPDSRMDPRHLETVLMNLVLNARDAMPKGGTITILSREEVTAQSSRVPSGRWVRLSVRDDGDGMSEETKAQVFEPFFTTKEPGRGTGLGLATVHGIVKQSEGHVTVDSALGEGTTFDLYLPLADSERPSAVPPRSRSGPRSQRSLDDLRRLLLVDDSQRVRRALASGLTERGFDVIEAGSAEEAREVDWSAIDVVVTDVVMPGTSGVELAQEILAAHPRMRLAIISGDPRGHDLSGLPARVARLQKPFTTDELVEALTGRMGGPS